MRVARGNTLQAFSKLDRVTTITCASLYLLLSPSLSLPPPSLVQYLSLMKELGEKVPDHMREAAAGDKAGVGVGTRVPPPPSLVGVVCKPATFLPVARKNLLA